MTKMGSGYRFEVQLLRSRIAGTFILLLGILMGCAELTAGDLPLGSERSRVEITAQRSKKTKIEGGDFDDKIDRISLDIKLRNPTLNAPPLEGYEIQCWVLAQSMLDSKAYKVVIMDSAPVRLTSDMGGRDWSYQTKETKLGWDNTGWIWGEKYEGWIVALLNEKREVIACKSSNPTWEKLIAKAGNLQEGKYYTSKLEPTVGPKR